MLTGRHVKCPKCGKDIEVPDRFHDFPCSECGETIKDTKRDSVEVTGPVGQVTNVQVELGPRIVMAGDEVLGTVISISIEVAEATTDELEKLRVSHELRLVKVNQILLKR